MNTYEMLLVGFVFCSLLMTLVWWVAIRINFYSLVDGFWALGIGLLGVVYSLCASGAMSKKICAVVLSSLWSWRLAFHLFRRLKNHFPVEDRRYEELKERWGKKEFFMFYQVQGISQVILGLPFLVVSMDEAVGLSYLHYLGMFIFTIGLTGEGLADQQLHRFKMNPVNNQRICDQGLWKYSRHPNYFFEFILWCGVGICSLGSPLGYLGVVSPLFMFLTLNFWTGVPTVEAQMMKSKGHLYKQYQNKTNRFFPGVPL